MSENAPHPSHVIDPSITAGNHLANPELDEKVGQVINYFNGEFGLTIDASGHLEADPTTEQLAQLKGWHEATSKDGIIMPDMDTFTAKMVLANALMPQRDESGNITYLFGKGAGAELALQGEVDGRSKKVAEVPFRAHSDFEIYGVATDSYNAIPNSHRFTAVFGSQEIYPVTQTKGIHELPPDYLHETAEVVSYGGVDFLVPSLELQFVDKFEKANEAVERSLREKTDAEWLATTYEMDADLVHATIDSYVIAPELAKFKEPAEVAERNTTTLERKLSQTKRRLAEDMPQATDKELGSAASKDFMLAQFGKNIGLADITALVNGETGQLVNNSVELLSEAEAQRQTVIASALNAKHGQIDAILQAA
ncbi:MAG TPA: hypothetical protein PKA02_02490 [Candidatus Saccharibacteria bacterium]|nr:hypothetical protein [Candidatus Saccharibacteria bacterium]